MPLKAIQRWTRERCRRKVGALVGPLENYVRRHRRWTIRLGLAFLLNAAAVSPFFAGMPLHNYWRAVGAPLLLLCLLLSIAFVSEAGWTFIHWQALREWRQLEWSYLEETRHVEPERH
jgi:hypothetical protein